MSVMLAREYGGTPWAWRGEAAPCLEDYATAVHISELIAEEANG